MPQNEVQNLATRLKTDSAARASFIKDMKGLLQNHGVDLNKQGVADHFGLTDSQLKNLGDRASSAIITITR